MRKTVLLRNSNPKLKVSIAIGGWNEGSEKYSKMAENPTSRATFIESVIKFIAQFDFDGVDIDWEYPGSRGGSSNDKDNFSLLLKVRFYSYIQN